MVEIVVSGSTVELDSAGGPDSDTGTLVGGSVEFASFVTTVISSAVLGASVVVETEATTRSMAELSALDSALGPLKDDFRFFFNFWSVV